MGRWLDAVAVYRDPRMALIGVLGFSSGLPLALSFGTLSAWLASTGIDRTTIVIVSHQPEPLEQFATQAAVLRDGQFIQFDTLEEAKQVYDFETQS